MHTFVFIIITVQNLNNFIFWCRTEHNRIFCTQTREKHKYFFRCDCINVIEMQWEQVIYSSTGIPCYCTWAKHKYTFTRSQLHFVYIAVAKRCVVCTKLWDEGGDGSTVCQQNGKCSTKISPKKTELWKVSHEKSAKATRKEKSDTYSMWMQSQCKFHIMHAAGGVYFQRADLILS